MPTDEIIIRLFCMVDEQLGAVNKREDAHLYPSQIVTIGLLFALKGGRFRAFYRWLSANYRGFFPSLPERTRLLRLLRDHAEDVLPFLAEPSFFTVLDTYGIELIHPRREGRSKRQIGKKGKSNGRSLVGIKLAWLINDDGETIALADQGLRAKDTPAQNIKCCERGRWNERFTIETNLSWVTELFHAKKLYHRVKEHLEARLWYLAALINCLLRITEHKRSLAEFVI
jgi:hypothetical protein